MGSAPPHRLLALGLVSALAIACAPAGRATLQTQPSPEVTDVGFAGLGESGGPSDVAWPLPDRLIVERIPSTLYNELVRFDLSTHVTTPIQVDPPPGCAGIAARAPQIVSGHVYFARECVLGDGTADLMALPPDGGLPTRVGRLPELFAGSFARLASGTWLADYGGVCQGIDLVDGTDQAIAMWPLMITDDGPPFAVNAVGHQSDCDNSTPLATGIAAAPDGTLALLAARGVGGFIATDPDLHLYLVDVSGNAHCLADGVMDGRNLRWAPNGASLALIGEINRQWGIWRFARDGKRTRLFDGHALAFAWSPDGSQLAVVVSDNPADGLATRRVIIVGT
jgi:hypothetical protein